MAEKIEVKVKNLLAVPDQFRQTALAFPDKVTEALALIDNPEDAKELLDKADAMAHYANRVKTDTEIVNAIQYGKLRIVAKLGELMQAKPPKERGRGKKKNGSPGEPFFAKKTMANYRKVSANKEKLDPYYQGIQETSDDPEEITLTGFLKFATGKEKSDKGTGSNNSGTSGTGSGGKKSTGSTNSKQPKSDSKKSTEQSDKPNSPEDTDQTRQDLMDSMDVEEAGVTDEDVEEAAEQAKVMLDAVNTPIPWQSKSAFAESSLIDEIAKDIVAIRSRIQKLTKQPVGRLLKSRYEDVKLWINNIRDVLTHNKPTHVCISCNGVPSDPPCQRCNNSGWTTAYVYQRLLEDRESKKK